MELDLKMGNAFLAWILFTTARDAQAPNFVINVIQTSPN
jgi:hypothetical protein